MPSDKKQTEFKITDRRRFSEDATAEETTHDREAEQPAPRSVPAAGSSAAEKPVESPQAPVAPPQHAPGDGEHHPPSPSAEQRAESDRAYKRSTDALDEQIRRELSGQPLGDDFKVGFDRVVEPLYVTALVQLGFMGQEGQNQRRVDIIGARQSIDALNLLQEKTKGNLTPAENTLLEDILYDLRMKYLEITNALARAVQNPPEGAPSGRA